MVSSIYYAAARDGNLPEIFSMINVNNMSPITSLFAVVSSNFKPLSNIIQNHCSFGLFMQVITTLLMLLVDDLTILILYGTFSDFVFTSLAISSIFYLRYKRPTTIRPIKVSFNRNIFI